MVFLKVDVDECEDIAGEYDISAMPTFVFIKKGKKVSSCLALMVIVQGCFEKFSESPLDVSASAMRFPRNNHASL